MPESPFVIRYELTLPGPKKVSFRIALDPKTLVNLSPPPADPPEWAALKFEKCPNCSLDEAATPCCPVARYLSEVVRGFSDAFSYDRVSVRVTVPERAYEQSNLPMQAALSSLLGIYMVTSGCPVLGRMGPMVRFHLPFASELETLVRASSMYLLRQYLIGKAGGDSDWSLQGLAEEYRATAEVNRAFARRLRAATPSDANVNALIRLDTFAQSMPESIDSHLEEVAFVFGG
jgi:hypothetical protein